MKIQDGAGTGHWAEVNDENELVVRAINEEEIEHVSAHEGDAYTWYSGIRNIDAADTMLFVQNTHETLPLIISKIIFNGSNNICNWEVAIGALTTTPTGTTVTGVNLNEVFSSKVAKAVASYDEGALAQGNIIYAVWTPVTNTIVLETPGLILGTGHYIQVDQVTSSSTGSVGVTGHYGVPS